MQKHLFDHALTVVLLTALLSGAACASIPNSQIGSYGTKWEAAVTVTQTIGCSENDQILSSYYSPDIKVRFSSDYDQHHTLNIKQLSRWYANSDFTVNFYEDGRLKSIGQTTTGQGETYIKNAITIASAVAKMAPLREEDPTVAICRIVNAKGNKKPITLTYGIAPEDSITTAPKTVTLMPTGASALIVDLLESAGLKARPVLEVELVDRKSTYGGSREIDSNGARKIRQPTDKTCDALHLFLQDTETVKLTLKVEDVVKGDQMIGSSELVVPKKDSFYSLPILKAKLFGKQTFNLKLTEAGAIDTLGYGMEAGGTGLMNALAAASKAESDILSSKAAEEKAKADILANQHRRVVCETKPADCK
jgi:hypothetical protein